MTYFNSFKKGKDTEQADREFPPDIASIFPNYKKLRTGLNNDYVTHTNQIIPTQLINTIVFQSFTKMTPSKMTYSLKKPDSFHVFPSYIINPVFPIILHVLNRSRCLFKKIFPKRTIDDSGVYRVGLFLDYNWKVIEIDDQIPIISNTILSTWCNTQEPWPALLEKALAKVIGGFEYLSVIGHGHLGKSKTQRTRGKVINTLNRQNSTMSGEMVT
jgi:hypothetical protein